MRIEDSSILRSIEHHSMVNMIISTTSLKVDRIKRKDTAIEEAKFANRSRGSIADHEFWAISTDDLILSRLAWAREKTVKAQQREVWLSLSLERRLTICAELY